MQDPTLEMNMVGSKSKKISPVAKVWEKGKLREIWPGLGDSELSVAKLKI